jgi:hypothetical protein
MQSLGADTILVLILTRLLLLLIFSIFYLLDYYCFSINTY